MFSRKHIAATFGIFALGISSAAMIGCGSSGGSSEERTEEPIETDPKPSAKEQQLAELEAAIDFIDSILDNLNTAVDARSSQTSFQHHVILLEDSRQQLVTAKSDAPSAPAALDNADAAIAAVELAQPIDTGDAGATSPTCGSEADSAEPAKTARKSIPRTALPGDLFGAPARAKRCVPPRRFSAGTNYRPRKHNYDERVLRTNRVAPFVPTLRLVEEEEEATRKRNRVRFATPVSTVVGHGSHVDDDPAHEDGPEAALFDREFEPRRPPPARSWSFQPSPDPALDLDDDLDYSGRPPFSLSLVRLADERPFDNGDRQSPTWYELQPEPLSPSASAGPPAGDYDWVDLPPASDVDLPLASDWAAPHGGDSDSTRAHHEDSDSDDDGLGARSHFFGEGDFLALPTPKSNPGRRAEAKFAQVIGVVQRGTDPNSQRITRFGIDSDAQDGAPFEQLRVALSDDEIYNVFGAQIQGTDKVFVRIRSVDPVSGREVAQVGTAEVSTRDGRLITAIHHLGRSSRLAEHDQTTRF